MDGRAVLRALVAPDLRQFLDKQQPTARLHEVGRLACFRPPLGDFVLHADEETLLGLVQLHPHPGHGSIRSCAVQNRVGDDLAEEKFDVLELDESAPGAEHCEHLAPANSHLARARQELQSLTMPAGPVNVLGRREFHLAPPPANFGAAS